MDKSDRIQLRINPKIKDKFGRYCHYHKSTITDQIEQFMVLCIQFHERIQQHAGRPIEPENPENDE